jgi:hypothetical protein
MPTQEIFYGVCSDSTGACSLTYLKALEIVQGFKHWVGMISLPGGGGGGFNQLNPTLKQACVGAFQKHQRPIGFCRKCGLPLAFKSVAPKLGDCPNCHREYRDGDLEQTFCGECGTPVSIDDAIREQMEMHKILREIESTIPELKRYGYLDH